MALDPVSHRIYLITADFGPAPAPTADRPHPRPSIVPDSFVLLVVGIMSLGWMVAIAGGVLLEKTWRHGLALSKVLGVALLAFALLVPAHPELLPGLHQTMSM